MARRRPISFPVRLDQAEYDLLQKLADLDMLEKSDMMRLSIREYARKKGLLPGEETREQITSQKKAIAALLDRAEQGNERRG